MPLTDLQIKNARPGQPLPKDANGAEAPHNTGTATVPHAKDTDIDYARLYDAKAFINRAAWF
jgi:hypothetical protein